MGQTCCPTDRQFAQAKPLLPQAPKLRWKQGKELGRGAYGIVYECLDLDSGCTLAVKHIRLSGPPEEVKRDLALLEKEIATLRRLSHRNIIKHYCTEVIPDLSGVYIIFEHASGGSLRDLLNSFKKFEEPMVRHYTKQLLAALEYLHRHRIVHRDVKCANILATHEGQIKLADFGVAKKLTLARPDYLKRAQSLIGSPYWMAPEIAKREGHSFPVDVWSVGCSVIEMLTGEPPWSQVSNSVQGVLDLLKSSEATPELPQGITESCRSFLQACLHIDPQKRPSVKELKSHPFITGL